MHLTHDTDDPPPKYGWREWYWHYANRWAEISMGMARAFGLLLLLLAPVSAQEVGQGLFCDLPEQAAKVVEAAKSRTIQAAIQAVNAGTKACAIQTVIYTKGNKVGTVQGQTTLFDIYEMTIVGFVKDGTFVMVPPTLQYGLFATPDKET